MFFNTQKNFIILCTLIILTACASKPLSPEMQIKKAQETKLLYSYALSECSAADALNANRRARKPLESIRVLDDCSYFRSKGRLEGYRPMSQKIPSLRINGMPIPFHEFKELQETLDESANSRRASNATIPAAVSSQGRYAETVYRNLIHRGFRAEEVDKIIDNAAFKQAVADYQAYETYHFDQ